MKRTLFEELKAYANDLKQVNYRSDQKVEIPFWIFLDIIQWMEVQEGQLDAQDSLSRSLTAMLRVLSQEACDISEDVKKELYSKKLKDRWDYLALVSNRALLFIKNYTPEDRLDTQAAPTAASAQNTQAITQQCLDDSGPRDPNVRDWERVRASVPPQMSEDLDKRDEAAKKKRMPPRRAKAKRKDKGKDDE